VTNGQAASIVRSRRAAERRRRPVRREDEQCALGCVLLALDEDRAAPLEVADDIRVVDDLAADVHRRPVQLERALDRLDGSLDARAVAARRGQEKPPNHDR
jgi:hypothetical protein